MKIRGKVCSAVLLALMAPVLRAQAPSVEPQLEPLLFHPLRTRTEGDWTIVALNLVPAAWRVGRADGNVSTQGQLRAMLRGLNGMMILGYCNEQRAGLTRHRCAFELRAGEFAGIEIDSQLAGQTLGWVATMPQAGARSGRDRYFGLLEPEQYVGDTRAAMPVAVNLRIPSSAAAWRTAALDERGAVVVLHSATTDVALASIDEPDRDDGGGD